MIFSYSARSKRSEEHQGLLFWDMITSDYYDIIRLLLILSTIKIYQFWTILIGLDRAKVCYLDIPYHDTNCNCNYQNLRTLIPLHCVKRHAIWIHNESMQISQPYTITASRVAVLRYDNIRLLWYYQTIIDSVNHQNISILNNFDRVRSRKGLLFGYTVSWY